MFSSRRFLFLSIIILIGIHLFFQFAYADSDLEGMENGSEWSQSHIQSLKNRNLIDLGLFYNLNENITREEFAYLAVKLFEALNQVSAPTLNEEDEKLFIDTQDTYVLKAYRLGIIKGYGEGSFYPERLVNREQLSVMLINTLKVSGLNLNRDYIKDIVFKDQDQISGWALESVRVAYKHKILSGTGPLTISPKSYSTREQVLYLIENILQNQNGYDTSESGLSKDLNESLESFSTINSISLKWKHGGAFNSWVETGWYASPVIVDLDGDGSLEIVSSAYSITVLDALTGNLKWRVKSGHDITEPNAQNVGRTWPDVIVDDIDGDGELEIVSAHGNGYVSVYNHDGYFEQGWPQKPISRELRGLKVHDLDLDGTKEVIVTAAVGSKENIWVFEHDGTLRKGWPQLKGDNGYAYGVFNNNMAIGDINDDSYPDIIVPSDVHYICAYNADGTPIKANAMYGDKTWGQVGVWESLTTELKGWGLCSGNRAESYRANFAHGASVITDVDGNGTNEVVAVGNMYNCKVGHPPGMYNALYIFNNDRSRFKSGNYNWDEIPTDTGAPLSENYNVIENNQPDPIVEDVDGDGIKEIFYTSYDGKIHGFWLDKTEHHNWPFSIYQPSDGYYQFGSVPLIYDINKDGKKEIIVASWTQKDSGQNGSVFILNYRGELLQKIGLPDSFGTDKVNGALASPVIGDIDNDGLLELVINTTHSGIVSYDIN